MSDFSHETSRDSSSPFIVWGEALLDEPQAALSDILSGRGARGPQQQAEPDDFLADLLSHPDWQDQRPQLIEGLDAALLNWLETHIEWPPGRINRFGPRAYAVRIADALKVAARLPLNGTALDLIQNQSSWDNRFLGMRWPGDIDLLRQFDLVLAQHQTDTRFASRWFSACDEAAWGRPFWRTRLNTGLIGLRKLPGTVDTPPESRVAAGLGRFGALALQRGTITRSAETVFRRRAAALTVLYPRHDGHWQSVWDSVLEDLSSRIGDISAIRSHWLDHLSSGGPAHGRKPRRRSTRPADGVAARQDALPDEGRLRQIRSAIDHSELLNEELWKKTRELIRAHWNFASRSGESHFAVRTTHNLCDRLLCLEPARSYLAEIQVWTFQAIEAEPDNPYIWDLWAKILIALGQDDASLSVRWESIRRFPDNCVLRSSLAEALLVRLQIPTAESLLRETKRDFPGDPFCRTILARFFARTYHVRESETDAHNWNRMQTGEGEAGGKGTVLKQEVTAYLDRLSNQVSLLEGYFSPLDRLGTTGRTIGSPNLDEISSEVELVAAHRAGLMEGPGQREYLEAWTNGRPSSYSARLLLAWQGPEGNGLDWEAMSRIARDFPENRRWNDWLRYAFLPAEQRGKLRQETMDGDETDKAFWSGRLSSVYPDLNLQEGEDEIGSRVDCDATAFRRLLEDIALAGADRALPGISIS